MDPQREILGLRKDPAEGEHGGREIAIAVEPQILQRAPQGNVKVTQAGKAKFHGQGLEEFREVPDELLQDDLPARQTHFPDFPRLHIEKAPAVQPPKGRLQRNLLQFKRMILKVPKETPVPVKRQTGRGPDFQFFGQKLDLSPKDICASLLLNPKLRLQFSR